MEKEKRITQATVLSMGFTKRMISDLLPEPELVENPHYSKAAPMKLWSEKIVLEIMQSDEYKTAKEKADNRKKSSAKAVETKKRNTMIKQQEISSCIHVRVIDDKTLRDKTLQAKEDWYDAHSRCYDDYRDYNFPNVYDADEYTINRWIVNYIRHNLVDYDKNLLEFKGRVGTNDAYVQYKHDVLEKIAEAYPKYADECEDQMAFIGM